MYAKAYIHCASPDAAVSALQSRFGSARREHREYYFDKFDMTVMNNSEADPDRLRTYPDGFLYYEIIAEIEIHSDYIRITDKILQALWDNGMPTVISCDYENELNAYIFRLR